MKPGLVAMLSGRGGLAYAPWTVTSLPANVASSNGGKRLTRSGGSAAQRLVTHPAAKSTGKFALRFGVQRSSTNAPAVGLFTALTGTYLGAGANEFGLWVHNYGPSYNDATYRGGAATDFGTSAPSSSMVEAMIELDLDAGKIWFGINGTWALGGNPSAGTGAIYSGISGAVTIAADMYYEGIVDLRYPDEFVTPATAGFTPGWPTPPLAANYNYVKRLLERIAKESRDEVAA